MKWTWLTLIRDPSKIGCHDKVALRSAWDDGISHTYIFDMEEGQGCRHADD